MKTMMQDVADFHNRFELTYEGKPRALPEDMRGFREQFVIEEVNEYSGAGSALAKELEHHPTERDPGEVTHLLEEQLDAMVDAIYVILGNAYLQGFEKIFQEAWDRVHHANMQKVRAARPEDSKRGSGFDVVKPIGWRPPSHTDLVEDNAHNA